MAMNNSNYGFQSSSSLSSPPYSAQFASTPANPRSQRPRFGFSNVPSYPRPRSSATKPNPDMYSDGFRSNYGNTDTMNNMRTSNINSDNLAGDMGNYYGNDMNTYGNVDNPRSNYGISDSMRNSYGNPDDMRNSFGNVDNTLSSYVDSDSMRNSYGNSDSIMDSMRNNYGSPDVRRFDYLHQENNPYSNTPYQSPGSSAYYSCNDSFSDSTKYSVLGGTTSSFSSMKNTGSQPFPITKYPIKSQGKVSSFGVSSGKEYGRRFQNKSNQNFNQGSSKTKPGGKPNPFNKKTDFPKKYMASKSDWRCDVCAIDFTSNIPFEMHLRGAKHAKKLKTKDVLQSIQIRVNETKEAVAVGNTFRCDICNVQANSSLQFQTHLDGVKHKNKLMALNKEKSEKGENEPTTVSEVNGKSNGSTIRPLPSDFGEPQPAKLAKFSCDICNIAVNSDIQLQQHLTSKKHQAKVEGKPIIKRKFKPKSSESTDGTEQGTNNEMDTTDANKPPETDPKAAENSTTPKVVVGIKTLSSSFVPGQIQK